MDLTMFDIAQMPGHLVPITGTDPLLGPWEHKAFVAAPLPDREPALAAATYRQVAQTRAALATLDSTASRLPNPRLFRRPALDREAQSTSALEGTYAPLRDVLTADDEDPSSVDLREIFNYVVMANHAFGLLHDGYPLTVGVLTDLQGLLVRGTPGAERFPGEIRGAPVVIGHRADAAPRSSPAAAARFVPAPPGLDLEARVRDLVAWLVADRGAEMDPVVAAALAHYQFETLHPFFDGNGRVGRLLIVVHLLLSGVVSEPTLSVSPWFESRRTEYYDRLLGVSARGDWDAWVHFFASGLEAAATSTHRQMLRLIDVQSELHARITSSTLRTERAHALVDLAVARPSFTVRQAESELGLSYARTNTMIGQLVELGVLAPVRESATYDRRFHAPAVVAVLLT